MNTLNTQETQRLLDSIQEKIKISNIQKGDILWFFNIENPYKGKTFRDSEKNLWKIYDWNVHVAIEAGINKAGVGDGKLPTHAMTYSINYTIYGQCRRYKHKYFSESSYKHKYQYARDIDSVINKFIESLKHDGIV